MEGTSTGALKGFQFFESSSPHLVLVWLHVVRKLSHEFGRCHTVPVLSRCWGCSLLSSHCFLGLLRGLLWGSRHHSVPRGYKVKRGTRSRAQKRQPRRR